MHTLDDFVQSQPSLKKDEIPFSLDENSFNLWLSSLNKEGGTETLQQLHHVLQTLKNTAIMPEMRLFVIKKISDLAVSLSLELRSTYLKNTSFVFKNHKETVKFSASCSAEVAENYALLCKEEDFSNKSVFSSKQQAEIVSRGIEAMNDVLLYNAFLYQKPSKGFWSLCYLFYFFAKKTQTLDFDVDSNGGCFINNFKHLLAFQLANVSQFDTEEIATIFALLKGHANHLNLHTVSKEKKGTTVLCINLKEDEPPRYVQLALDSEVPYLMYISSNEVSSYLFNTLTTAKNASYSYKILLLRLVKTVSVKQSRKTERVLANDEVFAEIGFSQLINFLLKKNQETVNVALNQAVPDFEIESITGSGLRGHEFRNEFEARFSLVENPDDAVVVEYIPNDEIWPASENKEELVRNAEFVDKSGSGFCLRIRGQKTVAQIGDIIRVEITDSSVVTVVRRIVKVEQAALVVGVEILGSAPEIIHVKDNTSEEWISGCLLKNSNGTESVIIKANEFKNKENLLIDNNQKQVKYHMEKILHTSTSVVKHVQITPQ